MERKFDALLFQTKIYFRKITFVGHYGIFSCFVMNPSLRTAVKILGLKMPNKL